MYVKNVTDDYNNITLNKCTVISSDYKNLTQNIFTYILNDYNKTTLSNCTGSEFNNDVIIPSSPTKPCGPSFLCLISLM